jgi:hypothetical protein
MSNEFCFLCGGEIHYTGMKDGDHSFACDECSTSYALTPMKEGKLLKGITPKGLRFGMMLPPEGEKDDA